MITATASFKVHSNTILVPVAQNVVIWPPILNPGLIFGLKGELNRSNKNCCILSLLDWVKFWITRSAPDLATRASEEARNALGWRYGTNRI